MNKNLLFGIILATAFGSYNPIKSSAFEIVLETKHFSVNPKQNELSLYVRNNGKYDQKVWRYYGKWLNNLSKKLEKTYNVKTSIVDYISSLITTKNSAYGLIHKILHINNQEISPENRKKILNQLLKETRKINKHSGIVQYLTTSTQKGEETIIFPQEQIKITRSSLKQGKEPHQQLIKKEERTTSSGEQTEIVTSPEEKLEIPICPGQQAEVTIYPQEEQAEIAISLGEEETTTIYPQKNQIRIVSPFQEQSKITISAQEEQIVTLYPSAQE